MKTEGIETFERGVFLLGLCIIAFCAGAIVEARMEKSNTSRPVEEIVKADSIIKVNDSIKLVINDLDSIKNAKIIEVQTLNNDSTIKLFYELISK